MLLCSGLRARSDRSDTDTVYTRCGFCLAATSFDCKFPFMQLTPQPLVDSEGRV